MGQRLRILSWLGVGALTGALATMSLQTLAQGGNTAPLPLAQLQQLSHVFGLIKAAYVEPVDEKKVLTDAISGMVSGLDPHSAYLDAKAFEEMKEGTSGKFVGVGIEITMEDGLVKVVSPIEDSPAFKAGLKTNDLITRIDTTAVRGLSMSEAVKRIRGEPDTKVVLTIFRKDEDRSFPVTIVREQIISRSVKSKIMGDFGWVRVNQFQEQTVDDLTKHLKDMLAQQPTLKGLVLDLRNNPGGLLESSVAMSAIFLPNGVEVTAVKGQLPESQKSYKALPEDYVRGRGPDPLRGLPEALKTIPMVVLVNEGSASASEIVSGALKDHKRATVMGGQTFGKGSVQTLYLLSETTAVKLTTARYYTPSGRSIQAKGVVPDIWLDENAEGKNLAALRHFEADNNRHLVGSEETKEAFEAREKARQEALKLLEDEAKKPPGERKPVEFGSDKDFQLEQALNHLKGLPVKVSKHQTERKEPAKEE